jgi:2-(1,2-epoxy-1,2-dihydrophenyl)acetyl-CoA isomerase
MNFETVLFEISDGIATLTLNRPDVLNGLNHQLMTDIRAALKLVEHTRDARVLILTGAGRAFCSGADLANQEISGRIGQTHVTVGDLVAESMAEYFNPLVLDIVRLRKPVISAVNGTAAGGGVGLALAGDIVIAAKSATFIQVFGPQLGIIPDMGSTWFLPRLIGHARSMGLALLGDELSAQKASEWGLIFQCVEDDVLMEEARTIARKLADAPPKVFAYMKQAFHASYGNSLPEQLELEKEIQRTLCNTDDFLEGVAAFLAKRKPDFNGK